MLGSIGLPELMLSLILFFLFLLIVAFVVVRVAKALTPAPRTRPCPDCRRMVSTRAASCPQCGGPLTPE